MLPSVRLASASRFVVPLALAILAGAVAARATVLTFDPYEGCNTNDPPPACNGSDLPESYGDRVTSILTDGFTYGEYLGFTPNVTVSYGPTPSCLVDPTAPVCSRYGIWASLFGDLSWALDNNNDTPNSIEITFSADDGYVVTLYSFDLALINDPYWISLLPCNPCVVPVSVVGDSGVLYEDAGLTASADLSHVHVVFGSGVSSKTLTLILDLTTLDRDSDLLAVDNIQFTQFVVPEPTAAALVLLGLVGLSFSHETRRR